MRTALTAVAAALLFGAPVVYAQNASIDATATVLTPITVTAAQNLAFGTVFPGLNKAVAYSDATNGGRFSVTGAANREVNVSFTLPTNLTSGGNSLPIDTWTGYHNVTNSASSGGSAFTPSSAAQAVTLEATGGQLYVFVGATVKPTATQAAGSYTAPVRMDVVYTGN